MKAKCPRCEAGCPHCEGGWTEVELSVQRRLCRQCGTVSIGMVSFNDCRPDKVLVGGCSQCGCEEFRWLTVEEGEDENGAR